MLRDQVVVDRAWITAAEYEDAIAACNLLPGPASTQLAVWSAWRVRGAAGGVVGGLGFVLPGLVAIVCLAALFLNDPPLAVRGAAAGAGAAVAAVALHAVQGLLGPSRERAPSSQRWWAYALTGLVVGAAAGEWVVVALVLCGFLEVLRERPGSLLNVLVVQAVHGLTGTAALVWVALKVGLLSYGGGFVIIPLMQHDAVERHHWMTDGQFLNAVALGQITPGPVVHTVAVVGFAAGGLGGALLAALVAFAPSFVMVIAGARRFDALRRDSRVQAFLSGAGPAVIGAIAGSAVPLALALGEAWQVVVLVGATLLLLVLRRGVVTVLLVSGAVGAAGAVLGLPLSG